jgi:hypothetical protein
VATKAPEVVQVVAGNVAKTITMLIEENADICKVEKIKQCLLSSCLLEII